MKTQKIVTILFLVLVTLLLSSCSLRNNPNKEQINTTTQTITTQYTPPPNQVYDYDVVLSDNARDVPPLFSLSPDIEKIFRVTNKRNTEAIFEIPQLDIYERIGSQEVKYVTVRPYRIGFYQMTLNSASYGTFQVK